MSPPMKSKLPLPFDVVVRLASLALECPHSMVDHENAANIEQSVCVRAGKETCMTSDQFTSPPNEKLPPTFDVAVRWG